MSENGILLLPLILPFIMGICVRLVKKEVLRNRIIVVTLIAELLLVCLIATGQYELEVWRITDRLAIYYHIDGIGKIAACLISGIWLLAGVYSIEYMKHEENPARFFLFYILSLGALMSLCFSGNMMTLYLSYEYMTILTVPLVIHTGMPDAVRAGMKYLGYSIFGAGLGLLGFFFLNTYCFTTDFIPGGSLHLEFIVGRENMMLMIFFLMMVGFGCKAGMFPLHGWLPTAHPVAPSPASAVLSGIITKGGIIAMIRVTYYLFGADFIRGSWAQTAILVLATVTIFMGSMLAYKEKLLKKRLAYSTVSQVSYVIFGLMLLTPAGFLGAMLQVVFHALAKNALFLSAGAMILKSGKKYVDEYRGIGKEMPVTMWCFALASLSLIGIPPTCGFISKWYLAEGALLPQFGAFGIVGVAVLMVSALLTAGYLLPIVSDAFFPGDDYTYATFQKKECNWLMCLPLVILAGFVVLLGIFPNFLTDIIVGISSSIL